MDIGCRRRCKKLNRNGNPGAVAGKYATGLQLWIRERKPSSVKLKEATKWADDYIVARQSACREKRCHNCGDIGHMYQDCSRSAVKEERKREPVRESAWNSTYQNKMDSDGAIEFVIL